MATESASKILSIDGQEVHITNPEKLYFSSQVKVTKLELVQYYLSVAPGALAGIQDRPIVLKRFVNGAEAEAFYQKRAPQKRPAWLRTVTLSFPSGRTAEEIVVDDTSGLAWIVNLGCIELHPHPVRSGDLDHPDELRIDLDPIPGVSWDDVRRVALEVQGFLDGVGLRGWPKTSGSRGMHVNVRIEPRWTFTQVRRAAVALSRAVERRAPTGCSQGRHHDALPSTTSNWPVFRLRLFDVGWWNIDCTCWEYCASHSRREVDVPRHFAYATF